MTTIPIPIPLSGKIAPSGTAAPYIARISTDPDLAEQLRSYSILLVEPSAQVSANQLIGFKAVAARQGQVPGDFFVFPVALSYLADGDIVRVDQARGYIRVLYRKASKHNHFLVTEQCNSRCLMCSQPPINRDDSYLADELLEVIPLIDKETEMIGLTGGEVTLLESQFLQILTATKTYLPHTKVFVLSNGRNFERLRLATNVGDVGHPSLLICIPLYSDIDSKHDFVVQAAGAFGQTIRGILNLWRAGVDIEIRVVIHQQTYSRLPQLAEFICRNLPFVKHVALMGLELTGFTKANLEALWIDPADYQAELCRAVQLLTTARIDLSIYNHQLCVLPPETRAYARQSISDWKNIYMPECDDCVLREDCGGFFASQQLKSSKHIKPFTSHTDHKPSLC